MSLYLLLLMIFAMCLLMLLGRCTYLDRPTNKDVYRPLDRRNDAVLVITCDVPTLQRCDGKDLRGKCPIKDATWMCDVSLPYAVLMLAYIDTWRIP